MQKVLTINNMGITSSFVLIPPPISPIVTLFLVPPPSPFHGDVLFELPKKSKSVRARDKKRDSFFLENPLGSKSNEKLPTNSS